METSSHVLISANINLQVVTVLKKDVIKSQSKDLDKGDEYRQILVQAIHSCAIKFPAVAANVILLLMGIALSELLKWNRFALITSQAHSIWQICLSKSHTMAQFLTESSEACRF